MPGYRVRCPKCREAMPEDAAWCSRCGAALAGEVLVALADEAPGAVSAAPAAGPAPEPRRARRRTRLAAALAATVAGGAVVLLAAPWRDGDPPPSAASTTSTTSRPSSTAARVPSTTTTAIPPVFLPEGTDGVRLVLARTGEVDVVDLDANTVESHSVAGIAGRIDDGRYLETPTTARRGDHLVFQADEAAFAVPLDFSRGPRRLGASVLFLASVAEDRVWLVSRAGDGSPSVQEVDLAGRSVAPAVPVPPDWTPRAAVAGGLVLSRGGRFQVWDPGRGEVRFSSEDGADVVAAGGRLVAWRFYCEGPFCPLHLTDVVTGRDRAVYVEGGPAGPGRGALSPDGRTLAFFVQGAAPSERGAAAVAFVDVGSGRTSFARSPFDFGLLTWSASGRWVFSSVSVPAARP